MERIENAGFNNTVEANRNEARPIGLLINEIMDGLAESPCQPVLPAPEGNNGVSRGRGALTDPCATNQRFGGGVCAIHYAASPWRALAMTGDNADASRAPCVCSSTSMASSGGQSIELRSCESLLLDMPTFSLSSVSDGDAASFR